MNIGNKNIYEGISYQILAINLDLRKECDIHKRICLKNYDFTKVFDDVNHISRKSLGYHEHERSIYTFGVTINKKRKRTQKILKIVKGNRKKSYFWGLDIKGLPPPPRT